jgi:hypothetical protein
METGESRRRRLHQSLVRHIGEDEADTIMDLLPAVEWTEIATKSDLESVRIDLKSELIEFRAETSDRFARLESRMAGFESRMAGFEERMAGFESRMAGFEERLNGLIPKLVLANVAIATAIAGLVFAAARFAGP